MLSLLFAIIFGLAIGFFATQNTAPVTLQFGHFQFDNIPLYLAMIGSLIVGLLIATLFYLGRTASSHLGGYGRRHWVKRSEIDTTDTIALEEARADRARLEQQVRQLESENARIRGTTTVARG